MKKEEVSSLVAFYVKLGKHFAQYCKIQKQQRALCAPQVLEHLEIQKDAVLQEVSALLKSAKPPIRTESAQSAPARRKPSFPRTHTPRKGLCAQRFSPARETHSAPPRTLRDIFAWLNPSYSYAQFLHIIQSNAREKEKFRSEYEEVETKRRVAEYLKKVARPRKCAPASFAYTTLREKSYCIPCRRPISNKMLERHALSKAHEVERPLYLRVTEAQANRIASEYSRCVRGSRMHLRHIAQKTAEAAQKIVSLAPYTETESTPHGPRKSLHACSLCRKTYSSEGHFARHFALQEHKNALKALGIKNPGDYTGLTTPDAVRIRRTLYFAETHK
ncbi:uncharacterized protein NEMAJ01_1402 [Nematocida major]|uniref:uncharacterized protein n=1 Tax=Nematocida major TaxID=1912982 RepID=UPI0020084378|nr:uncharacterized protein NEMAJ01_1402 [Nematocida major]KAH9386506.1 hypothetical protein NEMAJ01_1402 [Nematocida major]